MALPKLSGNSEFLLRSAKLDLRLEQLESNGYKPHPCPDTKRTCWTLKCSDCGRKGLYYVGRVFDSDGIYSRIQYAYCVDCGFHEEV